MKRCFSPLLHRSALTRAVSAPSIRLEASRTFRGCDLCHTPMNVDKSRACDAVNMIRDEIGQVRKRMGWHTTASYASRINGAFSFDGQQFIHAGTGLYLGQTKIGDLADAFSKGWTLGGKLYLIDGEMLRVLTKQTGEDGSVFYTLSAVQDAAYVPTVILSRNPDGEGTAYEDYNLLGAGFINSFLGVSGKTVYQLTDDDLDETAVTAQVRTAADTWTDQIEGTDFSVNRQTGTVTFSAAPGESPVLGEDNVRITAYKTREGYAGRINHCTVSVLFGVNGAADRLFLSGNADSPNRDWHSAVNDPTMFGDTCYSVLGLDSSAVVGYSVVSDCIAAHKDAAEDGRNIILRRGTLGDTGEAEFPIVAALQGESDIAPHAHAYLGAEPLFLTARGVYAITSADVTGEKYSQSRSALLDSKLTREQNLKDAAACIWNDFYLLCVNGRVYALDSLQKTYLPDEPYSSYQYEGYVLDHIPARVMWNAGDKLCFGTADGKVAEFYTDKTDPASYNDDGEAIHACWCTPYYTGRVRHQRKRFSYLSATLAPHPVTSVSVWAEKNGVFQKLFEDNTNARYFTFDYLNFAKLTFSTDRSPRCIRRKIDVGIVDKTRFRLENAALNEPFGIYDLTVEYMETGKF